MKKTEKISIYQVLPRLFGNDNSPLVLNGTLEQNGCGKFSDFTAQMLKEIRQMGFNHIWYTGVLEHATQTDYTVFDIPCDLPENVKGKAGSPYAIKNYYNIDPDLAENISCRIEEFEALAARTHSAGLKVIIDFVPNHVAVSNRNFEPQNFYYYPGSDQRVHDYEWTDTVKLNYSNRDTWQKMLDILFFWSAKEVDGFRCDMAEMVPVEFWEWAVPQVKEKYPTVIFIAEIYNPAQYGNYIHRGHFDYLYDKVGLYDTLRAIMTGCQPASAITSCWQSLGELQPYMVNFLENHDEQRIASDFFAQDPRKARPAMFVSATMNINPFLIYFGQELGERGMDVEGFSGCDGRTTIFDYWSISSIRQARQGIFPEIRDFYLHLLEICRLPAVAQGKFYDLMYVNPASEYFNPNKQYAYLRGNAKEILLFVANFDEKEVDIQVFIPEEAYHYFETSDHHFFKKSIFLSVEAHNIAVYSISTLPKERIKTIKKSFCY